MPRTPVVPLFKPFNAWQPGDFLGDDITTANQMAQRIGGRAFGSFFLRHLHNQRVGNATRAIRDKLTAVCQLPETWRYQKPNVVVLANTTGVITVLYTYSRHELSTAEIVRDDGC